MRTTLNLPDALMTELAALTGTSQKTEIIVTALREYERALRRKRLLQLRGKPELLADDFDPAALRATEAKEA